MRYAERQGYVIDDAEWRELSRAAPEVEVEAALRDAPNDALKLTEREDSERQGPREPRPVDDTSPIGATGGSSPPAPDTNGTGGSSTPETGDAPSPPTGSNGVPQTRPPERIPIAPHSGERYGGHTGYQPPRRSNERLRDRLGGLPKRRKVVPDGPAMPPEPGDGEDAGGPLPKGIETKLYAANLEYGFLRFSPADFRLFETGWLSRVELVGDDDLDAFAVAVDYERGILHGADLQEFLALQAWPYGAVLRLEATSDPRRYHLRAIPLDNPRPIGPVVYFDFDEDGVPVVRVSHPEPFAVEVDEDVYRQERRWENRHAYDALVARKGDGVLTAVVEALRSAPGPMTASGLHRDLMANGRPCSFFSVLGVLYGFECFRATDDHRWTLSETTAHELRRGYRSLTDGTDRNVAGPITPEDLAALKRDLGVLARPDPESWPDAIDRLLGGLERIRRSLSEATKGVANR